MAAIVLDHSRDNLLHEFGIKTLRDRYLLPGESIQEAFARPALAFSDNEAMAQRMYDYTSKLWAMYSTPILANGGTKRGLPISCYLSVAGDSRDSITGHYSECAYLSSYGGGIGGYWNTRSNGQSTSVGNQSSGVIPFIKVMDSIVLAFAQGKTRRGAYATYLDISHPEIEEYLAIGRATGGDPNRKCLNIHLAVNIPDKFMYLVEQRSRNPNFDDSWELIDPHSLKVTKVVSAKDLWINILETRMETGEPYLLFIDTANHDLRPYHYRQGLKINQSNLCSEVLLPTSEDRTAVCCLSSLNLEKYDEWKGNKQFIKDWVRFLDNVLSYFILHAPQPEFAKAIESAYNERSIGLGSMGFHSYLQSKGVAFGSYLSYRINDEIFSWVNIVAEGATYELAKERGPCPDAAKAGVERRNSYLTAIAPNASSSIICGNTSPGIEPYRSNVFTQKTKSGFSQLKNPHLVELLKSMALDTPEIWQSIESHKGSVQHLEQLSLSKKEVFKTAMEIDQRHIVGLAAARQRYIDQSQSLNLFFPSGVDKNLLHDTHLQAWKSGVKTLYYCRSEPPSEADFVSNKVEVKERKIIEMDEIVCVGCEG
jgi:ribonucleoside-diphosphate reductase alpha chain